LTYLVSELLNIEIELEANLVIVTHSLLRCVARSFASSLLLQTLQAFFHLAD
jgi:hypothetical protein